MGAGPQLSVIHGGQTPAAPSDDALWRASVGGDDGAFAELVRRHQPLVHRLVRRYTRSAEDARDLAQQVFLRAVDGRQGRWSFFQREDIPFRAWLCRVAINLGKNHARQAARWMMEPLKPETEPAASSPIEAMERMEKARRARELTAQLPKRQQQVLTLRIDGELPFAEIALTLGITVNNAKVHYHHAVKRLMELVQLKEE